MLFEIFLLFLLLFFLFLLSRKIATVIFKAAYLVSGHYKFSVALLSVAVLPGTLIHEFSHLVFASLLRVPCGNLTVFPTIGKDGEVKTGRLEIVKPDPFRHILIGLSPMIAGLAIIYAIGNFLLSPDSQFSVFNFQFSIINNLPITILGLYLLFATSSTMFSSRRDLESFVIAGPIVALLGVSFYLIGIRIVFEEALILKITGILSKLNYYLLLSAVIDFLIFVLASFNLLFLERILGRKISR